MNILKLVLTGGVAVLSSVVLAGQESPFTLSVPQDWDVIDHVKGRSISVRLPDGAVVKVEHRAGDCETVSQALLDERLELLGPQTRQGRLKGRSTVRLEREAGFDLVDTLCGARVNVTVIGTSGWGDSEAFITAFKALMDGGIVANSSFGETGEGPQRPGRDSPANALEPGIAGSYWSYSGGTMLDLSPSGSFTLESRSGRLWGRWESRGAASLAFTIGEQKYACVVTSGVDRSIGSAWIELRSTTGAPVDGKWYLRR